MAAIRIGVKLPAVKKEFKGSYSRVTKPSGVEYILLTIIGTRALQGQTWTRAMETLGIPEEISSSIFLPALERMEKSRMVECRTHPTLDDRIENTSFTELGRRAFEKGVIAEVTEDFHGSVAFRPASSSDKYVKASAIKDCSLEGFEADRFSDIVPDDQRIENKIVSDKSEFAVPDGMEVFDVTVDDGKEMKCYNQDVILKLDPVTGSFVAESPGLDLPFMRSRFTAEDIIGMVDAGVFSSSSGDVQFKGWMNSLPDWDSMSFILPYDIKFNNHQLVLVNGASCTSIKYMDMGDGQECDIILIDGPDSGAEICLVARDVTVEGFEGSLPRNIAVKRSVGAERISKVLGEMLDDMDVSLDKDFNEALSMASLMSDRSAPLDIVRRRLFESKNLISDISMIQNHRKDQWYQGVRDVIEEAIAFRNMTPEEANNVLSKTMTQVTGHILADHFAGRGLDAADWLIDNVMDKAALIRTTGAAESLSSIVLSCIPDDSHKSTPVAESSNMARALGRMKATFGMRSLSDYSFNIDSFTKSQREDVIRDAATFRRGLSKISEYTRETASAKEMEDYAKFFDDMAITFKSMDGTFDPAKADDRTFGIVMGIRLDGFLSNIVEGSTLGERLINAHEQKKISDDEYVVLNDFRQFRNLCAHSKVIDILDKGRRSKWTRIINSLDPDKNGNSQNKGGKKK